MKGLDWEARIYLVRGVLTKAIATRGNGDGIEIVRADLVEMRRICVVGIREMRMLTCLCLCLCFWLDLMFS